MNKEGCHRVEFFQMRFAVYGRTLQLFSFAHLGEDDFGFEQERLQAVKLVERTNKQTIEIMSLASDSLDEQKESVILF